MWPLQSGSSLVPATHMQLPHCAQSGASVRYARRRPYCQPVSLASVSSHALSARQAHLIFEVHSTPANADRISLGRPSAPASDPQPQPSTSKGTSPDHAQPSRPSVPLLHVPRRSLLLTVPVGGMLAWATRNRAWAETAAPPRPKFGASGGIGLDKRVQEFVLDNGLRFLVYERHVAPVVSCRTYADVGAFDEVDGQTGVAHLLEHMAFKGSTLVGTKDYGREAPLLSALDEVFYNQRAAEAAGNRREAAALGAELTRLSTEADALVITNEMGARLERAGAVGLNATTGHDNTQYFLSLPTEQLELWFALEAERFRAPVFRQLYSEKKVVLEERRMRVDNAPLGRFQEAFGLASLTNNYRRPVIGYEADIRALGRAEVSAFFEAHYHPRSLTMAVTGDVTVDRVRALAEKYLGGWTGPPTATTPSCDIVAEALPRPCGDMRYDARAAAGPLLVQAYYRPCVRAVKDSLALEMISDTLTSGRLSRLYTSLVLTGRALSLSSSDVSPAHKHANQFVIYGVPAKGVSIEALQADVSAELAKLVNDGPTEDELTRYRKVTRVSLLSTLLSNSSLAAALTSVQGLTGDWRNLERELAMLDSLTCSDVRDVAQTYLVPTNCFTGYVRPLTA